ncbi:toll/interleukin-1 receptor domain-containing protein [Candidatus Parcubacteria bacterium]|nr:toll/interleukin-1 receptor domain-containing protein [Candidatus Parcubacteria bacterium]
MLENQIFISYSSKNRDLAARLYEDLLMEGYPVWMDKALEEVKEWKPQIEDNLRKSNRFIVLISSYSVKSKWVLHEGSIAYALKQLIIPLQIEDFGKLLATDLPIWVEEKQLVNFVEGIIDYPNRLRRVKQYLGEPLPIQKHLEEMMIQYKTSGMLLSEVALNLIEKHKDKIEFPEGSEELIEKSRRALHDYWTQYAELERNYDNAKIAIKNLNETLKSYLSDIKFQRAFIVYLCITVAYYFLVLLYIYFN